MFPDLGMWGIDTQWSGYVAMTVDMFPTLAKIGEGFYGWIGCNGRGVALSVSMGKELAKLVSGQRQEDLAFPVEKRMAFPFRALAPIGIAGALISMRLRDRIPALLEHFTWSERDL